MIIDEYEFMLDSLTKFYNTVYVSGWFHHPLDRLTSVEIIDVSAISSISSVGIQHLGVANLGSNKGFTLQLLRSCAHFDEASEIIFRTQQGWTKRVNLLELSSDRRKKYRTFNVYDEFRELLSEMENPKVLDIGGRSRSKLDWKKYFPGIDYTVLDIISGENVDVVGDAHRISAIFEANLFDAIYCTAVFEHLIMPWKVVLEMNRCMKMGGLAFINTHQTIGMHDLPWDFFRFSDSSWDGLFNRETGFEILTREMDHESYILPFMYREEKASAECSAGFEASSVLVKKISDTKLVWDVEVKDIISSSYPDHDDGATRCALAEHLENRADLDRP